MPYIAEAEFVDQRRAEDVDLGGDALLAVVNGIRSAADKSRVTSDARSEIIGDGVAGKHRILRRDALVDSNVTLVGVGRSWRGIEEVTRQGAGRAEIRQGNQTLHGSGTGVHAVLRD